ncbi:MAG: hypothetical protein ABSE06_13920 [Anaerolineaceae bacterium]
MIGRSDHFQTLLYGSSGGSMKGYSPAAPAQGWAWVERDIIGLI